MVESMHLQGDKSVLFKRGGFLVPGAEGGAEGNL